MFFLFHNVLDQTRALLSVVSERPIAFLPMLKRLEPLARLHPGTGACFNFLDQIRQRNRRMQAGKNVEMIFNAIDAKRMAVPVLQNPMDICIQLTPIVFMKDGSPVL